MAYTVAFTVPPRPVGYTDIEFDVKKDQAMFGTLKVSQGGIVWRPRDATFGYFLSWNKLDRVAEQEHTSSRAL